MTIKTIGHTDIVLTEVMALVEKFRKRFQKFHPPQTFRYIDQNYFEKYFK